MSKKNKEILGIAAAIVAALIVLAAVLAVKGRKTDRQSVISNDACDVNVGLIMGPPSMGLGYFMNEAENGNTYNNYSFTVEGIDYSTLAAKLNDGTYDIITCPSNVSSILYNNKDLKDSVEVISINNLGLLHILTTDDSINSMEDLKGRTVYSIGEGGPPEYTFEYLLDKYGLTGQVNFSFRSTPFEVLNLLQDEPGAIALLPQPFVEVAKLLVDNLRTPIDVTEAWNKLNVESGAQSVTTVTVVRKSFLQEHRQAVDEYLEYAKKSTDYTLANVEQAAKWTEKYETFLNPDIAVNAITQCSICTITGSKMKSILSGFLQIMYELNPDSVGGKMPDDEFYYIPSSDSNNADNTGKGTNVDSAAGNTAQNETLSATDSSSGNSENASNGNSENATQEAASGNDGGNYGNNYADNSQNSGSGNGFADNSLNNTAGNHPSDNGVGEVKIPAGNYTVTANIWFRKEDSGLPLNPHITSDVFPPKDPVSNNALLTVDNSGNCSVRVPVVIQSKVMTIQELSGFSNVSVENIERDGDGNITAITLGLGKLDSIGTVVTDSCTASLKMGDLAMSISGFSRDQTWPAMFEMN